MTFGQMVRATLAAFVLTAMWLILWAQPAADVQQDDPIDTFLIGPASDDPPTRRIHIDDLTDALRIPRDCRPDELPIREERPGDIGVWSCIERPNPGGW